MENNDIQTRVKEIESLVASNEVNMATKRLMDLLKDLDSSRKQKQDAINIRALYNQIREDERRFGKTQDSDEKMRRLRYQILDFTDDILNEFTLSDFRGERQIEDLPGGDESEIDQGEPEKEIDASEQASSDEKTPFHKDSPSSLDYLGRVGFVSAMATWIDQYWMEYQNEKNSFVINIHGQWGAGKTTFLNLLQIELQKIPNNEWTVVWFNSWENRHIRPAWWPLLDTIYREGTANLKVKTQKKIKTNNKGITQIFARVDEKVASLVNKIDSWALQMDIHIWEWWWRFYSGRKVELIGFIVSLSLLAFILYWILREGFLADVHFMKKIEEVAKPIGLFFSLLSTVFLGTRFVMHAITIESAKSAEVFLQLTPDPIKRIKDHFNILVEKKINRPIIVFIDDLDRCDREYLVIFLESVQTLLNHQKIFYVIAADQRWLFAAFEQTYKEFKDSIKEPGKKIGYLFLEKIFQLSVSIPSIPNEARQAYLDYLLGQGSEKKVEERRKEIEQEFSEVESEQELVDVIQAPTTNDFEKVIRRDVAVAQSAKIEIQKATKHFLSDFAHLMEPNPRAMKRLVTYYGVIRAAAISNDESIVSDINKRKQLALWAIVRLRWPLLADYLEEYPEYLKNYVSGRMNKDIHGDVIELIKDKDVRGVMRGEGIGIGLDEAALHRFIQLKATAKTF